MPTTDKHPFGTPSWFDLMTPDLEGARSFYAKLFGWTYVIGLPETGNYSMAKVGDRNAAGIGSMPPGNSIPSSWSVYFNVEDLEATATVIKANGGAVMMGPMDVLEEGRLAMAADPTGAVFGLWQPRKHQGAGVVGEHGAMAWQEVHTPDAAKARDFYARVFQLEPTKIEGMDYWTLDRGRMPYGGVYAGAFARKDVPAPPMAHWLAYFAVHDTDQAVATVKSGGGKILQEPMDTPHGRMAVVADPWGAVFAVIKMASR